MVPQALSGQHFYPPAEESPEDPQQTTSTVGESTPSRKRTARPKLDSATRRRVQLRKDFSERLTELAIPNDSAWRALNKLPPPKYPRDDAPPVKPVRIAQTRRFWMPLESMGQYWDCGADKYWAAPMQEAESAIDRSTDNAVKECDSMMSSDDNLQQSPKRQRRASRTIPNIIQDHDQAKDEVMGQDYQVHASPDAMQLDSQDHQSEGVPNTSSSNEATQRVGAAIPPTPQSDLKVTPPSTPPTPPQVLRYTGYRIGTGREMPDRYRGEVISALVELAAWPWGGTLTAPRRPPVVQLGTPSLNVPVRQTASVYRYPAETDRRRAGWLEGPVMGLQARPEVEFAAPQTDVTGEETSHDDDSDTAIQDTGDCAPAPVSTPKPLTAEHRARLDLLREVGLLLQLAQQRRREGRTEVKPGEGKWWAEKPRWGGGEGDSTEERAAAAAKAFASWSHDSHDSDSGSPTSTQASSGVSGSPRKNTGKTGGDAESSKTTINEAKPSLPLRDARGGRINFTLTKRKTPKELWRELRCGSGYWDAKVDYVAVGKNSSRHHVTRDAKVKATKDEGQNTNPGAENGSSAPSDPANGGSETSPTATTEAGLSAVIEHAGEDGGWDDVFVVSSLNHHVSILRLHVHDRYLAQLEAPVSTKSDAAIITQGAGVADAQGHSGSHENVGPPSVLSPHWSIPELRRSRWFDLLNPHDRCEVFRLLWSIMAYLNREYEGK